MMLMADRDVMTLPLRKRKLYMSDNVDMTEADHNKAAAKDLNPKVMRHSSVIQFAKASQEEVQQLLKAKENIIEDERRDINK